MVFDGISELLLETVVGLFQNADPPLQILSVFYFELALLGYPVEAALQGYDGGILLLDFVLQEETVLTLHVFDNFSVLLQFEAPLQLIYFGFKRGYFVGIVSRFQF